MSTPNKKSFGEVHLNPPIAFPHTRMDTKTLEAEGYIPISFGNLVFDPTHTITGPCVVKVWILCTALRLLNVDECRNLCNFLYPLRIKIDPKVTVDGIRAAIIGFMFGESENLVSFLSRAVFSKDKPDYASLTNFLNAPYFSIDWSLFPEPTMQEIDSFWTMDRLGKSTIRIEFRKSTSDYARHGYELRIAFNELEKSMQIPEGYDERTLAGSPTGYTSLLKEAQGVNTSADSNPPKQDHATEQAFNEDTYRHVHPGGQSTPLQNTTSVPHYLVPFMDAHDYVENACLQLGITYITSEVLFQFLETMAVKFNEDQYIHKRFILQQPEQLATAVNDYLISVVQSTGLVSTKQVATDVLDIRELAEELRTLRIIPKDINERLAFIETSTKNILSYLKSGEQRIQPATLPTVLPVVKPLRDDSVQPGVDYAHRDDSPLPQIDLG